MQLPNFSFEQALWQNGHQIVAGTDEVGRGAFAGPVVTSCVIFKANTSIEILKEIKINDSKKLSAKERQLASAWIKSNCLAWAVGESSVTNINNLGIVKATNKAFRQAIKNCNCQIDFLLIDAFYIP